jgi:hypothetical protein
MAGFTFMMAKRIVFIIMLRKNSEDNTRSAIANITNSIITIILTRGNNIRATPGTPQDKKIGGNET